ncbi:Uncharacterised protein [Mycobacterium tuberculosis]|nr:Uncharacterised protein [Mycobacterium tuberculosis]
MFSISTIASSTSTPMTRESERRVTVFSEYPASAMKAKAGAMDNGSAAAAIQVARMSRRNHPTTRTASTAPSSSSSMEPW